MPYLIKRPENSGPIRRAVLACLSAAVLAVSVLVVSTLSGTKDAQANGVWFGGSGVGIAFGTGGYRGGFFYGGFAGPPYRPYGPPYYYHPYDMRAYPYRSRVYPRRSRVYIAPRTHVGQPQRVPVTKNGLAPFTPQWVAYCSRKFKSFNPNTGTYLAYSGKYRFCR